MMLQLVKYPNAILKNKCKAVPIVSQDEKDLLKDMAKVMYNNRGIGLAAPQIGVNKQIAVVDTGDGIPLKLINPVLLKTSGLQTMEEGCLSIPNVYIPLRRPEKVQIKYLDENGRETSCEAEGLKARAILHEIDHLNGRLIIDHVNPIKRMLIVKRRYAPKPQ